MLLLRGLSKLCRNLRKSIEQKNVKFFACEIIDFTMGPFPFYFTSTFDKDYLVFNPFMPSGKKKSYVEIRHKLCAFLKKTDLINTKD